MALRIRESVWRSAAQAHQDTIYELLKPGLTDPNHVLNSGIRRQQKQRNAGSVWTALDPRHPVYNFLIEYYGLKGVKGVRRLARWSPAPHPARVLLEGATESDLSNNLLFLRGAMIRAEGIEYNPSTFFETDDPSTLERTARPFLWFQSVLQRTTQAEPVLHCYGLHEWAMLYQPDGAPPPPAAQYQAHLPLRVDRATINEAVERKGVRCTHIDALRFFAPAALPLNAHSQEYSRHDQLRLEQPACVHANMDLLKYTLRLRPFVDSTLLQRALHVALQARTLDVAASPYDCWDGYGVEAVPIETAQGRAEYRCRQLALLHAAEPVRRDLLQAYNDFLGMAFPTMVK